MGVEENLPPSNPPPPIYSPPPTPVDHLLCRPGFDFTSAAPSLGLDFQSTCGFDYALSTQPLETPINTFNLGSFGASESPSFGLGLEDLGTFLESPAVSFPPTPSISSSNLDETTSRYRQARCVVTSEQSQEGTVVESTVMNHSILTQQLERLPGETADSVAILVDPADHQNVLRAYKLLKAALVKSAFFCVARQQLLDPDRTFYLYQLGSDRLEDTFSEGRTESHDSNVDALQLSERLSSAADTLRIFDENPEWHQGHLRQSWSGKEADHVNPTYFTGDQSVKNVVNNTSLAKHGIDFDFYEAFSQPGVDMLCPKGNGIYPGNSKDKDRSILSSSPAANAASGEVVPSTLIDSDDEEEPEEEHEPMTEIREGAVQPADLPYISLEDLLPEPEDDEPGSESQSAEQHNSPAPLPAHSSIRSNDWLEYTLDDGTTKRLHKASILSSLFNSDYRHLAVSRLLRVRCYTKDGGRKPSLNHQEFSGKPIKGVPEPNLYEKAGKPQ
ncbi:hypothetical protein K438DRAFT_1965949 [Mycena galopus ATCC 62051]|nr:hypothetical protein K438DRAFT_1965949 [Mycena galopus ATCC 62051]